MKNENTTKKFKKKTRKHINKKNNMKLRKTQSNNSHLREK